MEKILAIYDLDRRYTERLGNFLKHRKDFPFQVHHFGDSEELQKFSKKKEIDVLLFSKECENQVQTVEAKERVLLSEVYDEIEREENSIYKYQSGDAIVQELIHYYGEFSTAHVQIKNRGRARLYMVFSPVGRSGKTSFALQLAKRLGEHKRTLFISLEESSSLWMHLKKEYKNGLSDAIYYFKKGNLDEPKLLSFCHEEDGFAFIPMIKNPDDLSVLNPQELSEFLNTLAALSTYSSIVIDTDPIISRFSESFSLCRKVFIPIREDEISTHKLGVFHDFLDDTGHFREEERFVKLLLPLSEDQDLSVEDSLLRDREMESFTDAVIQHYIWEQGA